MPVVELTNDLMTLSDDLVVQKKCVIYNYSENSWSIYGNPNTSTGNLLVKNDDADKTVDWVVWHGRTNSRWTDYNERYVENIKINDISQGFIIGGAGRTCYYLTKDGKLLTTHNWNKYYYDRGIEGQYWGFGATEEEAKLSGTNLWRNYGESLFSGKRLIKYNSRPAPNRYTFNPNHICLDLKPLVDGSTEDKKVKAIYGNMYTIGILMETGRFYTVGDFWYSQQYYPYSASASESINGSPAGRHIDNHVLPELKDGVKFVYTGFHYGMLVIKDNGKVYSHQPWNFYFGIIGKNEQVYSQLNNGDFGPIFGVYVVPRLGYLIKTRNGNVIPTGRLISSYYYPYINGGYLSFEDLPTISYIVTNEYNYVMLDSFGKIYTNSDINRGSHSKRNPYERISDISGITDIFSSKDSFAAFKRGTDNKLEYVDSWPSNESYYFYTWVLRKTYIEQFYDVSRGEVGDGWKVGIDKVCCTGGVRTPHWYILKDDGRGTNTYKLVYAWGCIHGSNDQHLKDDEVGNYRWNKLNGGGIKSVHSTNSVMLFLFDDDKTIMTNGGLITGSTREASQIPPEYPDKTHSDWRSDNTWQQGAERTFTFNDTIQSITSRGAAFTITLIDNDGKPYVKEIGDTWSGCQKTYVANGLHYDNITNNKKKNGYGLRSNWTTNYYPNIDEGDSLSAVETKINIKTDILDKKEYLDIYSVTSNECHCDESGNNVAYYMYNYQNFSFLTFPIVTITSTNIVNSGFITSPDTTVINIVFTLNSGNSISNFNTSYLDFLNCSIVNGESLIDNSPLDEPGVGPWELNVIAEDSLTPDSEGIIYFHVKINGDIFNVNFEGEEKLNLPSKITWRTDVKCIAISFYYENWLLRYGYTIVYIDFYETIADLTWDDLEFTNCNDPNTSYLAVAPWKGGIRTANWRQTWSSSEQRYIKSKYFYIFPNNYTSWPWGFTTTNITDTDSDIETEFYRWHFKRFYSEAFSTGFTANVKVSQNKYNDTTGNTNLESSEIDIPFIGLDNMITAVNITATFLDESIIEQGTITSTRDIIVTIVFEDPVIYFDRYDLVLTNVDYLGNWSQSDDNKTYIFNARAIDNGDCIIEIAWGRGENGSYDGWWRNQTTQQDSDWIRITDPDSLPKFKFTYDTLPPEVEITSSDVEPSTYTNSTNIPFSFRFTEPIFNFTNSDIVLTPSLGGNFTTLTTTDNVTFNTFFTPNGGGNYKIEVFANSYKDAAENQNIETATFEWTQVLQSNCFVEGTIVKTDQGNVEIQTVDPKRHTINKKKIKHLTGTFSPEKRIVCVKKHAFGKNKPNKDTKMSGSHKILYDGCLTEARQLVNVNNKIKFIDYNNECLYNVLMEQSEIMYVHNIPVETLHPENTHAKLYNSLLHPKHIYDITKRLNKAIFTNNKEEYIAAEYELRHPETIKPEVMMAYDM